MSMTDKKNEDTMYIIPLSQSIGTLKSTFLHRRAPARRGKPEAFKKCSHSNLSSS
jgi:hypothetical protein